jgi:hypothetical protein
VIHSCRGTADAGAKEKKKFLRKCRRADAEATLKNGVSQDEERVAHQALPRRNSVAANISAFEHVIQKNSPQNSPKVCIICITLASADQD